MFGRLGRVRRSWWRRGGKLAAPASIGPSTTIAGAQYRSWTGAGFPRWLWSGGTVQYALTIPPQTAAQRLAAAVKPDTLIRQLSPVVGLVGWVKGAEFQLTTRLPFVSNSFDSILDGEIRAASNGSLLVGRFRMRKLVLAFLVAWVLFASLLSIPAGLSALLDPKAWKPGPPPVLLSLLFPLLGIGVLVIGRLISHWQERRLVSQLDRALGFETLEISP